MNEQGMNEQGMNVTVIGCDGRPFGPEAAAAIAAARAVVGAPRHLRLVPDGKELIELKHLDEALDTLTKATTPTVVLASGDPGFFGIVRALRARGITPNVIPAVSSVADAFARIGEIWAKLALPTLIVQEGGYSLAVVADAAPAFIQAFRANSAD